MNLDAFAAHREALRRLDRRPTPVAALLATLVPLAGVLLFDWPVAAMMGFYWLENVAIGVFHVLKLLAARGLMIDPQLERALAENPSATPEQRRQQIEATQRVQHALMPGLFVIHYGLFCLAHLAVIVVLFDDAFVDAGSLLGVVTLIAIVVQQALDYRRFRADAGLVALPRGWLFLQPYPRIFVLQFALLAGALPALAGYPLISALLLAAIKLTADLQRSFGAGMWDSGLGIR